MKQKNVKRAHGCLQALAVPVVILFVIVTVPITLVASFSATLTSRTTIKAMIDLDEFVRTFMVQSIEADIQQSYIEFGLSPANIDSGHIRQAIDLIVPTAWVDGAVYSGVDSVYDFLENGRTDDYILNYTPILEGFQGEAGREALTIIASYYPPCPPSFNPTFEYAERNVEISCIPANMSVGEVGTLVHQMLNDGFMNDPEIGISGGVERVPWSPTILAEAAEIQQAFHILEQLQLLLLIPLGLLALIALFTVRSWSTLAGWVGIPLILTGFLVPVAGIALFEQYTNLLFSFTSELGVPEELLGQLAMSLVENAAYTLRNVWFLGTLLQAFLMLAFGIGTFVVAFFVKRRNRKMKSLPVLSRSSV